MKCTRYQEKPQSDIFFLSSLLCSNNKYIFMNKQPGIVIFFPGAFGPGKAPVKIAHKLGLGIYH
jgi:hypothetical protein